MSILQEFFDGAEQKFVVQTFFEYFLVNYRQRMQLLPIWERVLNDANIGEQVARRLDVEIHILPRY